MKILVIAHCTDLSGANKSLLDVVHRLREKHDVRVLVNSDHGKLVEALRSQGIEYIVASYSWWYARSATGFCRKVYRYVSDWLKYWRNRMTSDQLNAIQREHFDCVYTNTSVIDVGYRIATILGIPHYWHLREYGDADFAFRRIRSVGYMKRAFSSAKRCIFISKSLYKSYQKRFSITNGSVVYNGFSISALSGHGASGPTCNGVYNILVTGQVIPGKGQDQAIQAVSELYHDDNPVHLFLAGQVDQSYLRPILQRFPDSSKWLTVLGSVANMHELRDSMYMELVCSHSEAFGRVTVEAMLHRIPVIGARSGATPELVEDNETGFLFELGNVKELKEKILYLIHNPDVRERIVSNAYVFANKFTIDNTCRGVEQILESSTQSVPSAGLELGSKRV